MLKIVRKPKVEVEEIKEESKMKNVFKGLSLKKKVLIGAGLVGTTVLGVFAYGQLNKNEGDNDDEFEDGNGYADEDELERDLQELEEMEKQENQE